MEIFNVFQKHREFIPGHPGHQIVRPDARFHSSGKLNQKFVPGLDVPDHYINRLKGVPKDKVAAEGIKIAVEQIHECLAMKGVAGPP